MSEDWKAGNEFINMFEPTTMFKTRNSNAHRDKRLGKNEIHRIKQMELDEKINALKDSNQDASEAESEAIKYHLSLASHLKKQWSDTDREEELRDYIRRCNQCR